MVRKVIHFSIAEAVGPGSVERSLPGRQLSCLQLLFLSWEDACINSLNQAVLSGAPCRALCKRKGRV